MKILLVTQDFPPQPGGIAVVLANLCEMVLAGGDEVEVVAQVWEGHAGWDRSRRYPIHRYRAGRRPTSLIPIWEVLRCVWRARPSAILVGHAMSTCALGVALARLLWRIPYAVFVHGWDAIYLLNGPLLDRWVASLMLRWASAVFTNSRYMRGRLLEEGWVKAAAVVVNPGVDADLFHPATDGAHIRSRFGLEGQKVAMTVGRLVRKKNHENVLRAIPLVLREVPNFRYLIVGAGPEEARLRRLAGELGVDHEVLFTGHVRHEDLPSYYCACDVLVMPSCEMSATGDIETFGIVFCEANACGKPVIGSRSGGIEDAVVDGRTGLLVDAASVEEIAAALIRVLSDAGLAGRLGRAGRLRIERALTWAQAWEKVRAPLASVARGR